uniref:Helix-turn-helix transcriptional regulator n=1 Tax=Phenylobacterium glaciei TaxID=2803784 RepID=A0A974P4V5_9CAUL|nr:helix-turn-helix transcriptional regulator [Phenylobacterium glaciei]
MSQEALAEQCGVSFQQIQKYENGANRISFSRLVQIARALRCRVVDLMDVLDTPAMTRWAIWICSHACARRALSSCWPPSRSYPRTRAPPWSASCAP